ncbi:MAG: hypothetical protein EA001_09810 [Oscillatoriales cyanobacterium]|nr:MAG: hypothetical protein EA001_09810 [Oscillatoriales cyanobacterium]
MSNSEGPGASTEVTTQHRKTKHRRFQTVESEDRRLESSKGGTKFVGDPIGDAVTQQGLATLWPSRMTKSVSYEPCSKLDRWAMPSSVVTQNGWIQPGGHTNDRWAGSMPHCR